MLPGFSGAAADKKNGSRVGLALPWEALFWAFPRKASHAAPFLAPLSMPQFQKARPLAPVQAQNLTKSCPPVLRRGFPEKSCVLPKETSKGRCANF